MTMIVETARIRLRDGAGEADLVRASDRFQQEFLDRQPGFVRRELLRLDARTYLDLIHWRDRAAADAVMALAMQSDACLRYFSVMDMSAADDRDAVSHYAVLACYPPA